MTGSPSTPHADYIAQALATEGGHLSVGRYGSTLYFSDSVRLSTPDTEDIKAGCAAAGPPVIDSRPVPIGRLADLVMKSPEVRVGPERSEPHWRFAYDPPWGAFSFAPLEHVIELYREAGAEVLNWPPPNSLVSEAAGTGWSPPVTSSGEVHGLAEVLRYDAGAARSCSTGAPEVRSGADDAELLEAVLRLCAPGSAPGGLGSDLLARLGLAIGRPGRLPRGAQGRRSY